MVPEIRWTAYMDFLDISEADGKSMTNAMPNTYHEPVLLSEAINGLAVRPGGIYIDCTVGGGGHATAFLDASKPDGKVLGIDADPEAVAASRARMAQYGSKAVIVQSNFAFLESVAEANGFLPADGILIDLGLSSRQLDTEERGFSFQRPGPLDMRFSPEKGPTAADLIQTMSETDLASIIYRFGEEPRSRRIARAIVHNRPVTDALQLAQIVAKSAGYPRGRIHPATRTFQALRIAVNNELDNLQSVLEQTVRVLREGGRLVTISYHSLEDRLIKLFVGRGRPCQESNGLAPIFKKVIKPTSNELLRNRRSRSARLRIAEKVYA